MPYLIVTGAISSCFCLPVVLILEYNRAVQTQAFIYYGAFKYKINRSIVVGLMINLYAQRNCSDMKWSIINFGLGALENVKFLRAKCSIKIIEYQYLKIPPYKKKNPGTKVYALNKFSRGLQFRAGEIIYSYSCVLTRRVADKLKHFAIWNWIPSLEHDLLLVNSPAFLKTKHAKGTSE